MRRAAWWVTVGALVLLAGVARLIGREGRYPWE